MSAIRVRIDQLVDRMNTVQAENVALGVDCTRTTYRAVKTPCNLTSDLWMLLAQFSAVIGVSLIFLRWGEIIDERVYGSYTLIGVVALAVSLASFVMARRVSRLIKSLDLREDEAIIYYREYYRYRLESEITEALKRREEFQNTRKQLEPVMEKILKLKSIIVDEMGGEFKINERLHETRIDYTLSGKEFYCYAGEEGYAKMLENVVETQERKRHIQELEARLAHMG